MLTEEGRASRIGFELDCKRCDEEAEKDNSEARFGFLQPRRSESLYCLYPLCRLRKVILVFLTDLSAGATRHFSLTITTKMPA